MGMVWEEWNHNTIPQSTCNLQNVSIILRAEETSANQNFA